MTPPDDRTPAWRAVEVGPGGLPVDQLRPVDKKAAAPTAVSSGPASASGAGNANSGMAVLPPEPDRGPSAIFGDFDFGSPAEGFDTDRSSVSRRPARGAVLAWLALAVGAAVLVAALLWSDPAQSPGQTSGALSPGSCLTSSSGRSVVVVDCADPGVEFTVAATYPGATDGARCAEVSSDLMLVTRDEVVLCLNYRAVVGECLYAGQAADVGKAPCRIPGSTSTPVGLFRVLAVLPQTIDVRGCPTGTLSSLVHVTTPEVLCLGLP